MSPQTHTHTHIFQFPKTVFFEFPARCFHQLSSFSLRPFKNILSLFPSLLENTLFTTFCHNCTLVAFHPFLGAGAPSSRFSSFSSSLSSPLLCFLPTPLSSGTSALLSHSCSAQRVQNVGRNCSFGCCGKIILNRFLLNWMCQRFFEISILPFPIHSTSPFYSRVHSLILWVYLNFSHFSLH